MQQKTKICFHVLLKQACNENLEVNNVNILNGTVMTSFFILKSLDDIIIA